jgi:hypothetical protein
MFNLFRNTWFPNFFLNVQSCSQYAWRTEMPSYLHKNLIKCIWCILLTSFCCNNILYKLYVSTLKKSETIYLLYFRKEPLNDPEIGLYCRIHYSVQ